ncbi:MAG: zf-TFIIB domain-containing protein [Deltaproteobacteria bacterium]|nr:zf-TFIIB domain-containing protein [Deltaproteobacteria bacterium]
MREVSAKANPGQLIVLDQCAQCGGIWCDKWELFPIDPQEGSRLDSVDEKLLQQPFQLGEKALYCPRCTAELQLFREPLLPADIQLQRCPRCEGIWLNRGYFNRYKNFQRTRKGVKAPKPGQQGDYEQLARAYQDPKSWVTTGTRGIFAYPRGEEAEELTQGVVKGGFRMILQALLRMVLGSQ